MEKLPVELKQHICDLLDNEDLRSMRVLNRTYAHVAALHLFGEIFITPLSLERLRLIAQHEFIATCVNVSLSTQTFYFQSCQRCGTKD